MAKQAAFGLAIVLFALPFVAAGVGMTAVHVHNTMRTPAVIDSAEPVSATVVSTDVEPRDSCSGAGCGGDHRDFAANITYTYTVNGTTYTSSRTLPPPEPGRSRVFETRQGARDFLANHPENQTVTAHYLPADPGTAFLVKHRHGDSLGEMALTVGGFLLFALIALGFLLLGVWIVYDDVSG